MSAYSKGSLGLVESVGAGLVSCVGVRNGIA